MLRWLFGCNHANTTWPLTPKKRQTYVVCLDCGKEFSYNWAEMRMEHSTAPTYAPTPVTPSAETR
jgi:hypothetical protein